MHALAERLLKTIRKQDLIRPGDRLAVAVSGGADSVALLLLLLELRAELGIVLSVAHVNHKLRGEESDEDERFVAELARHHGLDLHAHTAPLDPARTGIEAAARELRYDFFRRLTGERSVSKVATAHTLDDQAETVLLRILRGTGIRGLSGIHPRIALSEFDRGTTPSEAELQAKAPSQLSEAESDLRSGEVIRPLLAFRRAELQEFLRGQNQLWREDSTNRDTRFLRNRVRHRLIPVIAHEFGDDAIEHLADLAEIARAEEEHWKPLHCKARGRSVSLPEPASVNPSTRALDLAALSALPLAAQRRLIREWMETNQAPGASFRLIEEILDFARAKAGKTLELPAGLVVVRTRSHLQIETPGSPLHQGRYEYPLPVPGAVEIPELGICVRTTVVDLRLVDPKEPGEIDLNCLLDPERLPPVLTVRSWRPGDRYLPAHTKAEKKVKELLSSRHVVGSEKKLWPVVVAGADLVWMRGFPTPASFQPAAGASKALCIQAESIS